MTLKTGGQSFRKIVKTSPSAVSKTIKCQEETGSRGLFEERMTKSYLCCGGHPPQTRQVNSSIDQRPGQCRTQSQQQTHLQNNYEEKTVSIRPSWQNSCKETTAQDRQKRLVWAKELKEQTLNQWKSVLWSEDSKFKTFGSIHRVFVRRRKGKQMDTSCLVPTVKHGGGGVMVWGCFSGDTVGDLFQIDGTLNQHGYHTILQWHAIPSCLCLVEPSFIFQQDNDPKHTSRVCKGGLTKKEVDSELHQMTWPPKSPDQNQSRWFGVTWTAKCRQKGQQVPSISGNYFRGFFS